MNEMMQITSSNAFKRLKRIECYRPGYHFYRAAIVTQDLVLRGRWMTQIDVSTEKVSWF